MSAEFQRVQERIKAFDFSGLFTQELMWNHYPSRPLQVPVDGVTYELTPIAQRGMAVFLCIPPKTPLSQNTQRAERLILSARRHENISLSFKILRRASRFGNGCAAKLGKPSAVRQQIYYAGQSGDGLFIKSKPSLSA